MVEKGLFVQNPVVLPGRVIPQRIPTGRRESAGPGGSLWDVSTEQGYQHGRRKQVQEGHEGTVTSATALRRLQATTSIFDFTLSEVGVC